MLIQLEYTPQLLYIGIPGVDARIVSSHNPYIFSQ